MRNLITSLTSGTELILANEEKTHRKLNASTITTGACLCGEVRFEVRGPLRGVVNCHCSMCQRLHGNFGPHTKARKTNITINKGDGLAWFKTSDIAQRGFCRECGSSLFWEPFDLDATGIIAGSLDTPTKLKTIGHIFVGEKSDFYDITDDLPQFHASSDGELVDDYK
ncbi:MAG: GFA family protein [Woeseiaceae bacterium]